MDSIQLSTLAQLIAGGYPYDSRDYIAATAVCVLGMFFTCSLRSEEVGHVIWNLEV